MSEFEYNVIMEKLTEHISDLTGLNYNEFSVEKIDDTHVDIMVEISGADGKYAVGLGDGDNEYWIERITAKRLWQSDLDVITTLIDNRHELFDIINCTYVE